MQSFTIGLSSQSDIVKKEKEIQNGPIFNFYKELIRLRKEMSIISEGSYQPAFEDSKQVYAFERHLDGQKLLVLNHFYGSEAEWRLQQNISQGACSCQTMTMQSLLKR